MRPVGSQPNKEILSQPSATSMAIQRPLTKASASSTNARPEARYIVEFIEIMVDRDGSQLWWRFETPLHSQQGFQPPRG